MTQTPEAGAQRFHGPAGAPASGPTDARVGAHPRPRAHGTAGEGFAW